MSNPSLFKRRLGKFSFTRDFIEECPQIAQEILSTVIVVRAEMLYDRDAIEYVGLSHSFESLPCGVAAPHYTPWIKDGHFDSWTKNK